ncbi:phage tail protein I [Pseudomonas kunmingensis]|uniref:phage tail protein I n=1 Tax=Stutzerimonas kunmingensis TaxID=1211807 RepID=UPI001747B6BA|nr:phage tail protein I [Stutzerimonas kunmingensis]MBD3877435.1 phage tail protein I [Stutzerimonas kunmingensis]
MSDAPEAPRVSLLPANASLLELGLDLAFAKLLDRIQPPFPELMDPLVTPASFLPYLAADRGVSEWRAAAPDSEKRTTVVAAWQTKRLAGTGAALRRAVESLELEPEVVPWHQQRPVGEPYTVRVLAWISRAYDRDINERLDQRLQAAQSERDQLVTAIGISAKGTTYIGAGVLTLETITIYPGAPNA